jgi:hypothetical protein
VVGDLGHPHSPLVLSHAAVADMRSWWEVGGGRRIGEATRPGCGWRCVWWREDSAVSILDAFSVGDLASARSGAVGGMAMGDRFSPQLAAAQI